jgi:hypothetical protein
MFYTSNVHPLLNTQKNMINLKGFENHKKYTQKQSYKKN